MVTNYCESGGDKEASPVVSFARQVLGLASVADKPDTRAELNSSRPPLRLNPSSNNNPADPRKTKQHRLRASLAG